MFDALKKLFGAPSRPERHFGDDDARLALAALLVHCVGVDGVTSDPEQARLKDVLARTFKLPADDLQLLISDAMVAEREAVDLYRFTSVLKRGMSETDRVRVVEDLWEIVFADGKSHEFEENLVWRVAELLGVNRQDRIARKRSARENMPSGDGGAG